MINKLKAKYHSYKNASFFKKMVSNYQRNKIPKNKVNEDHLLDQIKEFNTDVARELDTNDLQNIKEFKECVATTYFILKKDPQFGMVRRVPDIKYIAPWYDSMKKIDGCGIIIHDGLEEEFIKEYTTSKIKFVKFNYGSYSIFEERWIGYYLLLKHTNIEKIFFTDCNDVFISCNPFSNLEIDAEKLYVGRDQADRFGDSGWVLDELNKFQEDSGLTAPETLAYQPLFNAGVVGGDKQILVPYIAQVLNLLFHSKSDDHKDMTLVNWAIHNMFLMPLKGQNDGVYVDLENDFAKHCENVVTGYPLNSPFKSYQLDSNAVFIHK
jgi:hypothetical protein